MDRRIEYDVIVGNPNLPAVDCKTFQPGRDAGYLAMLAMAGHLGSAEDAYRSVHRAISDDPDYSELVRDLPIEGRIDPSLFVESDEAS